MAEENIKSNFRNTARKKLVLTGGHAASTAFVVINEIARGKKRWDLVWIGFEKSVEGQDTRSLSAVYFPKHGIKTYSIISGRIQTRFSRHTLPSLLKIPFGFIHAFFLLIKIRPNLILSFGGFSAFPVVVVGFLLNIPVLIHEQSSVAGRANRFSAYFARKIAISRQSSARFFPKSKTVLTGNPTPVKDLKPATSAALPNTPTVLITGGQSGSRAINDVVETSLTNLLKSYRVIHLTGTAQFPKFKAIRGQLKANLAARYSVYGLVDPQKYNALFNSADIVVSRAGANTVSKLLVAKKPAVLIPLAISYLDEQRKNAEYAEEFGVGFVISQSSLSGESLLVKLSLIKRNWPRVVRRLSDKISPDTTATSKLINLLSELVNRE